MKRRRVSITSAVIVATLAVASSAAGAPRGGLGLATWHGVGPLRFGRSTPADLQRFAGRPDHVAPLNGATLGGMNYSAEDLIYRFSDHGSAQYYFVNPDGHWVLDGFETSLPRFHTARGTHTSMSLGDAEKREGIHRTSSTCIGPALLRRSRGGELGVLISGSRVIELFALGPRAFAFC